MYAGGPGRLGPVVALVVATRDETPPTWEPSPWDYLLGSIHWLDGFGIDDRPRLLDELGVEEAWRRYFEALAAAAYSGLFDSLSHPDVIKIFDVRPDRTAVENLHEEVADAIAGLPIAI